MRSRKKTPSSRKRNGHDPDQTEFGILLRLSSYPFRLRAGYVIRVNECAAVVIMNRPVRDFKTRFDKPVCFQPPPALFRISPQAEVPILNRK